MANSTKTDTLASNGPAILRDLIIVVVPDVTASNRETRSTLRALKRYKCLVGDVSAPVMHSPNMTQNDVTATKSIRFHECRR